MTPEMAQDAVAFSVETHAKPTRQAALCLVRVERRRSDRYAWDRVLDETTELQTVNYVSRLERHRFEYRVSLTRCSDPQLLAMPSHLWVSRVRSGAAYHYPHVGTFRLIKAAQRPVESSFPAQATSGNIVSLIAVIVVLVCAWLFTANKFKVEWAKISRWLKHSTSKLSSLWRCRKRPSIQATMADAKVEGSVAGGSVHLDRPVFEDRDEEGSQEPDLANELLMTELPDFNDESGWRDFFESQIYQREDRLKQPEIEERSGPVRQRTLITRSSNNSETRRTSRSTKVVAAAGKQPIYSSVTGTNSQLDGISQGSVVSGSPNTTSLRHTTGYDSRAETTKYSASTAKPQHTALLGPSSPGDDFGEFWQM